MAKQAFARNFKRALKYTNKQNRWLVLALVIVILATAWYFFKPLKWSVESFGEEKKFEIVYVYSPTCVHCKQFDPTWKEFESQLVSAGINNVKTVKSVDADKYDVKGFPSVVLMENGKKKATFEADRTTSALWTFVRTNLN